MVVNDSPMKTGRYHNNEIDLIHSNSSTIERITPSLLSSQTNSNLINKTIIFKLNKEEIRRSTIPSSSTSSAEKQIEKSSTSSKVRESINSINQLAVAVPTNHQQSSSSSNTTNTTTSNDNNHHSSSSSAKKPIKKAVNSSNTRTHNTPTAINSSANNSTSNEARHDTVSNICPSIAPDINVSLSLSLSPSNEIIPSAANNEFSSTTIQQQLLNNNNNVHLSCGASIEHKCAGLNDTHKLFPLRKPCAMLQVRSAGIGYQIRVHFKGYTTAENETAWLASSALYNKYSWTRDEVKQFIVQHVNNNANENQTKQSECTTDNEEESKSDTGVVIQPTPQILTEVHIAPIDGSRNQCLFEAIAKATESTTAVVQLKIRRAINQLKMCNNDKNEALWNRLHLTFLNNNARVTQEMFHKALDELQNSDELNHMQFGTEKIMCLYSYACKGKIAFRIYTHAEEHTLSTPSFISSHDESIAEHEITLVYSSMRKGGENIHFDLVQFKINNNELLNNMWEINSNESSITSDKRQTTIQLATNIAVKNRWSTYATAAKEDERIARQLKSPINNNKSPTKANVRNTPHINSPPKRNLNVTNNNRLNRTQSAYTPHQRNQPLISNWLQRGIDQLGSNKNNRSTNWSSHRILTIREIHGRSNSLFCQTMNLLFNHYRELASAARPDYIKIAELVNCIMDYPRVALFKARGMNNNRRADYLTDLHSYFVANIESLITNTANNVINTNVPTSNNDNLNWYTGDDSKVECIDLRNDDSNTVHQLPLAPVNKAPSLNEQEEIEKSVNRAKAIMKEGGPHCIQRSANALSSVPLAPMNQSTFDTLTQLHPPSTELMDPLPAHACAIASIDLTRLGNVIKKRIHNGSSPGLSGWSGSHIATFWNKSTSDSREGFGLFIRDLCNGVFNGNLKQRLLASVLVPLSKKNNGVRPIAVQEVFIRCVGHYSMESISEHMPTLFPSIQFGVQQSGGSESASQLIRAELDYQYKKRNDVIAISTDIKNAFNAINRNKVWQTLMKHQQISSILNAFYWQYNSPTPLLVYNKGKLTYQLRSTQGVRQGCPFAGFAFALAMQPIYEQSIQESNGACNGFSIQDDFTIIGFYKEAMKSYDYIKQHSKEEFGLQLVNEKCQVYVPALSSGTADSTTIESIINECQERQLIHSSKLESLGVLHGNSVDVIEHCNTIVSNSERFFECISHPNMPTQIAETLLRYCGIPKLGYLIRTIHPNETNTPTSTFDNMSMKAQLNILGLNETSLNIMDNNIHTHINDTANTLRLSHVTKEQLLKRISLPISMSGFGIRSINKIRYAAYYSSLIQILPYFIKLHPELRDSLQFSRTQLCLELMDCQSKLKEQGADSIIDTNQFGIPPANQQINTTTNTNVNNNHTTPNNNHDNPFDIQQLPQPSQLTTAPISLNSRFIKPSTTITQPINTIVQHAITFIDSITTNNNNITFAIGSKLQHHLTQSIEGYEYMNLFHTMQRYQQTIMTSLTMNNSTSAWLTTIPWSHEPDYYISNEYYKLAARHRLGIIPYNNLINESCSTCGNRDKEAPSILHDPDHMHSCISQTGSSVTQRHNTIMEVMCKLAIENGYSIQREPAFPAIIHTNSNNELHVSRSELRGDILMIRHNEQLLLDCTIHRPTAITTLTNKQFDVTIQPLITATVAEKIKHSKYDTLCEQHQWKLIPFALETYGAKGIEAQQLLKRMSTHSVSKSPHEFIQHAERLISCALQIGNAQVAANGTNYLHLTENKKRNNTDHFHYPTFNGTNTNQTKRHQTFIHNIPFQHIFNNQFESVNSHHHSLPPILLNIHNAGESA